MVSIKRLVLIKGKFALGAESDKWSKTNGLSSQPLAQG